MTTVDRPTGNFNAEAVPFKTLGELGVLVRGNGLQKSDLVPVGMPAIHYGEIHTTYGTWTDSSKSFVTPAMGERLRRASPGNLVIATTSEDDAAVAKATAWLGDADAAVSGDAYIFRHELDPRFVAYYFQTEMFRTQKAPHITGTKVRRISGDSLAKMRVPVPPRTLQREIARVLDKFANLEAELETQLEAELEARQLQRKHHLREVMASATGRRTALGGLGQWVGGITPSKSHSRYWEGGSVPWLASMDVSDSRGGEIRGRVTAVALEETSLRVVPGPSVAVVMRSNILRRRLPISLVKVDTTVNQDVRLLTPHKGVLPEFVYYALRAAEDEIRERCVRTDGSMAAVETQKFLSWEITLPSAEEQVQLVERMQAFDTFVNDLSANLPAELAARRKQYEYYRDKLLTFEEDPA